jgi:hypothetical protein
MMTTLAILAALTVADDKEDLGKAVQKAMAIESYTFRQEVQVDGPINAAGQIPLVDGKHQREVGTLVRAGERGEFFRKGEKVYVKQFQGDWMEADKALPAAGQGDQQARRRSLMGRLMMRNVKAPHEELKDFEKGFKELKKDEKTEKVGDRDCTVYGGDLTEEAIKASPLGRTIGQLGQLGGGAGIEVTGKGRAWVDAEGNLLKYELVSKISGEFNGNAFEFGMTRGVTISDAGKTKVEIPEALMKLLGTPSEDKKPEEKKDF